MPTIRYLLLIITATFLGFLVAGFSWIIHILNNQQSADIYLQDQYKPQKLVLNVNKTVGVLYPSWQQFAQGGEEAGKRMLVNTSTKMAQIKPGYVRLDHIFDDDYYGIVGSDGVYDFSRLDMTVNDIQKMGAKPFFSLGYMPKSIASSKIDMPYSWQKWQDLVRALIAHYSGKSGKNIPDVYYEVWNEPDLESFGSWHYGGDKNYLTLYAKTASVAKELRKNPAINFFKIGGPATTALYKNWVKALVRFAYKNNLPLDFISWHRYSYYPTKFQEDLDQVNVWQAELKDELGKPVPFEKIVSEWGPDSEKTPIYAGKFSAAFSVASISKTLGINGMYAFEVKDGPGQGNQGWGIFDFSGKKVKPRYWAFHYLKDMYGRQLSLSGVGENVYGWAVMDNLNQLKIVLTNYQISNPQALTLPFEVRNLSAGDYLLNWESSNGDEDDIAFTIDRNNKTFQTDITLTPYEITKINIKNIHPVVHNKQAGTARNQTAAYQVVSASKLQELIQSF